MAKLKLASILENKNMTQQQLSEETGINKSTINRYCKNLFEKIDMGHIDILCGSLDITPNELFEIESGAIFDELSIDEVLEYYHYDNTRDTKLTVMKNYLNYLNSKLHNLTNQEKILLKDIESITSNIKKISKEIISLKQEPCNLLEISNQIISFLKNDVAENIYNNDFQKLYSDILSETNSSRNYIPFKSCFYGLIVDGYINDNILLFIKNHENLHPYLKLYFEYFYNMAIHEFWNSTFN